MLGRGRLRILGVLLLLSCGGGGTTAPESVTVAVAPERTLLVQIGSTVRFTATVTGGSSGTLEWSSSNPAVATVTDGLATAVSPGAVTITASSGNASASADLEVYVAEALDELTPGGRHFGRAAYAEFLVGDLPLVLSSPHGGELLPDEIPDRTFGVTENDLDTQELTRAVRDAIVERTGRAPHVVISRLRRLKLDPNREIGEAAEGNVFAENAWAEYHGFIERAEQEIAETYGSGLYIDMHGHGHAISRLELGYLLSASDLANSDTGMNESDLAQKSSLRQLQETVGIPFSELIRGPASLGTLMADRGVPAVPSAQDPAPGTEPYFAGGYSTARHGSRDGGTISGIQIEHWRTGLRDTEADRRAYAAVLADALLAFLQAHYGFEF